MMEKYEKYYQFFKLIIKYWNSDIAQDIGQDKEDELIEENKNEAKELVEDLKNMGPTYIKLGQLLSTRPDMLPKVYLEELESLQDDVSPIPYEEVEQIFEQEIGQSINKAFHSFNKDALATASIGQVHEAVLLSGKKVAVKIQKPGIKKQISEDLDMLLNIAHKAEKLNEDLKHFSISDSLEEFQYNLLQELDYRKEAKNLQIINENLKEFPNIIVPFIVPDYCSKKVLTMEYISGQKATDLSPFQLQGLDRKALVDEFIQAYLKQIIVDGIAHADPHPGNIHVNRDGQIVLLDLGMVARFDTGIRKSILKLLIGLGNNDAEEVNRVLLDMSLVQNTSKENLNKFKHLITRKIQENEYSTAKELKTGQSILELNKIAALHEIKLPIELVFLGKILLNLDQIIAFLSPEHQLQDTVKSYANKMLKQYMKKDLTSGSLLQNIMESKELVEELPYRLNKISKSLADKEFKMEMKVIDENRFILVIQKIANRITTGIIVAALIMGAAMIMNIDTEWKIMGYPGFAIILFVFAALVGMYLVYEILFKDET